jgi:hypothetical protein
MFLQGVVIQCFSEVMAMLWLADQMPLDNIALFLDGQFYVQVLAMKGHTVLLRNDGRALAFGSTSAGQCNPSLTPGTQYISGLRSPKNDLVVQLDFVHEDDAVRLRCSNLGGQEMLCLNAHDSDPAWGTHKRIACELNVDLQGLRMVLPDGQLLTSNLSGNSWSDSCECGKPNNSKSQASVSHIVIVGAEP